MTSQLIDNGGTFKTLNTQPYTMFERVNIKKLVHVLEIKMLVQIK